MHPPIVLPSFTAKQSNWIKTNSSTNSFSLFWIALATFLTTLITFILALRRKASPIAVAIVTFLWALGWLALFGYGIYEFHSFQISFFCSDYGIGAACGAYITEFICFLLSPFEA